MSSKVLTGLAKLRASHDLQSRFSGNVGLLCHSASVDTDFKHSVEIFIDMFGEKFKKIYGPQHGFVTDVQDNMIETDHFVHPYFKRPVYSLYSETRIPTDEMLQDIDHLFVDLQDVGTRIYTYIYTLTLLLEKCSEKDIEVIVLDRPNPVDATTIEGNILDTRFSSFVGRHPIPVRHALTMAEVAKMHQKNWASSLANLQIISMENYKREMDWSETGLPYVNPSPNLATPDSCYTFVGTVLFEGTNLSEGRGTTRALEQIGHPRFDPWKYQAHFQSIFEELELAGFQLRPVNFYPMFQKHEHQSCGGYFIHVTDKKKFRPWRVSQVLLKELKTIIPDHFQYKTDAYEYEFDKMAIDLINGDDRFKAWYDRPDAYEFLDQIEEENMNEYLEKRREILLY
ncbi:MAG: hypothetical protein CME62_12340 [Halobacteriovoraceae bacterium]|nr:hypothetical protein [Halobacteriovoraceae bacterium]|tara:strand:+ start:7125 stop:8318 length:1194 start_codon:yes stop_codon:yes gene_type:complete